MSYNKLSSLPESLWTLTNLQVLGLGGNELSSLPESLWTLTNLQELYLSYNKLSSLPESLLGLPNLKVFYYCPGNNFDKKAKKLIEALKKKGVKAGCW